MSEKEEIWNQRVASGRARGETAKRYSAGRGWLAGTLLWWSSRLGRETPPPAVRLAQLVLSPAPHDRGAPAGAIIIELLDARVRIVLYVHVAEAHHREVPEVVRIAGANEPDADARIIKMLGARGSHVAAEPSLRGEMATITAT
jgi:hypothetical protein